MVAGDRRLLLRLLFLALTLSAVVVAPACSDEEKKTSLQPQDFAKPEGEVGAFNRNIIVDPAAFLDADTLDTPAIQRFLGKTPYARPSFLETYQSNGIRAADAIVSAARQYRINPLAFLVFAEVTQGLVGERNYPFPPERVEYVFNCGCLQKGNCLPHLAGFDRQVDCLGRQLRNAIDQIKLNAETTTGWGPNKTSVTLDGLKVTPDNDATAALYDRTPRVNENEAGGTWVYWNVWNLYAFKLQYTGPVGNTDGRWIGEACVADGACGGAEGAICASNYPDGLCTVPCKGQCPSQPSKPETFCAKFRDNGFCFPVCNPSAPVCRQGYKCARVVGVSKGESKFVCSPEQSQ